MQCSSQIFFLSKCFVHFCCCGNPVELFNFWGNILQLFDGVFVLKIHRERLSFVIQVFLTDSLLENTWTYDKYTRRSLQRLCRGINKQNNLKIVWLLACEVLSKALYLCKFTGITIMFQPTYAVKTLRRNRNVCWLVLSLTFSFKHGRVCMPRMRG